MRLFHETIFESTPNDFGIRPLTMRCVEYAGHAPKDWFLTQTPVWGIPIWEISHSGNRDFYQTPNKFYLGQRVAALMMAAFESSSILPASFSPAWKWP